MATRMAPTISRRSTAIGWRRAMVSTARSSITYCRLSISTSAATTRRPSETARRISASTDSTIMRSARPPISATSRVSSCRSLSNALAVCSEAMFFSSAEPAGDVVLGTSIARRGEDFAGLVEFDQLAKIHEGGLVRDARGLLHVMGDDGDGVVLRQLLDQFLDLRGRDRIERRAWLVEQNHLGPHRHGAGNAKPLLLAAGQAEAAGAQLVLDLVPQRAAAQRLFHTAIHLGFRDLLVEPDAERDVFVDRHRKRRRLLEHHADARAQQVEIESGVEDVGLVKHQLPGGALPWIEIVHPVENPQQRRLAAAGWPNEGRNAMGTERQVNVLQGMVLAIVEVEAARRDLCWRLGQCRRRKVPSRLTHRYGKIAHFAVLSAPMMRAPIFKASTVKVMSKAPLQASCFQ